MWFLPVPSDAEIRQRQLEHWQRWRPRYPRGFDLFVAVYEGWEPDVRQLLAAGTDANVLSATGETPMVGATQHAARLPIADLLVAAGGRVDVPDDRGQTPLHHACDRGGSQTCAAWLLTHGADPNAQTTRDAEFGGWGAGWTPLHFAVHAGALETVDLLLRAGANPNLAAASAQTPLHVAAAAYKTYKRLIRRLVDGGADVNPRDSEGQTPLHVLAAGYGRYHLTCARFLVSRGADASIRTVAGAVAADVAVQGQPCSAEMRHLLLRRPTLGS